MTWTWFLREFVSNELHATSNKCARAEKGITCTVNVVLGQV